MGEIADAMRRARGQGSASPDEVALRGLDVATSMPAEGELQPEPLPTHWVDTIEPDSPAVVPEGPQAELSRQIALRLSEQLDLRHARSVAVVSAERGDGKSTLACNLALALASMSHSRNVALVDLDLRKPSLARCLRLRAHTGMEHVLRGESPLEETLIAVRQPAIDVYPVASAQNAAHELLALPTLPQALSMLEQRYGTVIIDTPPAPLVPDARLILPHVGCCVPVVRKGKTRMRSLKQLLQILPTRRFAGWVMNCDDSSSPSYRYDEYYGDEDDQ